MSAGEIMTLLGGTGGGVGLVMLTLFITGQVVPKSRVDEIREERDEWRRTAELAQQRAESAVITGQIVRDVMGALKKELR
jgi:ABC-type hemin transport system ATPase subunit